MFRLLEPASGHSPINASTLGKSVSAAFLAMAMTLATVSLASAQEATDDTSETVVDSPELAPVQDDTIVRSNHGAWSIICDQPPGSAVQQCALMQNVIADDRPEIGLSIAVLKTADRQQKLLRIMSPLGVYLPEGMGLFVDGANIGKTAFSRCYLDGCYVEVVIDDDLMKILRAGKEAVFTLNFSIDQDTIGIPVDLSGFAEGYDALP